jgi:hypothetical protein
MVGPSIGSRDMIEKCTKALCVAIVLLQVAAQYL